MNSSPTPGGQPEFLFSSEEYYRVSIHLPVAKGREKLAAKQVIAQLHQQFDAYTYSNVDQPCFNGRWTNRTTGRDFKDLISILTIDISMIGDDPNSDYSDIVADAMWSAAEAAYTRFGVGQDTFWIAVSRVSIREKVMI